MAKLIYQCDDYDTEISIKVSKNLDIYDFLEVCEKLALAISYHPNSWKDGILAKAEEYETEKSSD